MERQLYTILHNDPVAARTWRLELASDDPSFVATNPLVLGGLRLSAVRDAFLAPVPAAPMYIPLLWISYMLDVSLFGNHPWAFHLTNILLHAASSLLLFLLLRRLAARFSPFPAGRKPGTEILCLLLCLLWSLHPLRVESVAWVAERKDCLAVFFCLLVLHAWISALDARQPSRRILHGIAALVLFVLGLLSKPSLVPLPLFLAFLALPPGRPSPRILPLVLALIPFLLLALLSSFATTAFHAQHAALPPPSLLSRFATLPSVIFFYLSKTLLPVRLSVLYPQWTSSLWMGALLSLPLLAAAVWVLHPRRASPLLWFGVVFATLFLLPVSGLVPVSYNLVADRYSLLPALGLSIALLGLSPLPSAGTPSRLPRLFTLLLALFATASAVATAVHLPVWRDSDTLFLPVRRLLPDHYTVRAYDARRARDHGDFVVARECAARAYALFPDYYLFLADVPDVNALEGPQAALDLLLGNPPPPPALTHWTVLAASAQLSLDCPADALATTARALPSSLPGDPFRNVLLQIAMVAAHALGDTPSALAFAHQSGVIPQNADTLVPGHFIQYYMFLWNNNDRIPALRYFRALADSDPTPSVLNNIAWLLATALWSPAPSSEAVDIARRALDTLPPDSPLRPTLLDTLSVALANDGQYNGAVSTISEAITALPPSSPSLPAMQSRLALYRQSLPYRELLGNPVPPDKYSYDPHL